MSGESFSPKGWLGTGTCHRISREVVTASSLSPETFGQCSQVCFLGCPAQGQELDSVIFVDPSNSPQSMILRFYDILLCSTLV